MVANKFLDDFYASNHDYARIGMVDLDELNTMEHCFVGLMHWRLQLSKGPSQWTFLYQQLSRFSYDSVTTEFDFRV